MSDNTNNSAQQPLDDASRFGAVLNGGQQPSQNNGTTPGGTDDASRFAAVANQKPQPVPQQTQAQQPSAPVDPRNSMPMLGTGLTFGDIQTGAQADTGFLKGAGDTIHGIGEMIRKGLNSAHAGLGDAIIPPAGQQSFDKTNTAQTPIESAGKVAENIAEFALGDEGLKGLSLTDKLTHIGKVADLYEKSGPIARRAIETALNAVRTGTVAGTQTAVKTGGNAKDAATAAVVGAAASPVVESAGGLISKLGSKAPIEAITEAAPSAEDAGTTAKEAAARVRNEAGQAVAAAKQAAVPQGFTMKVTPDGPLFKTLSDIDDQIGAGASGLESLKDPALDVVRGVSSELSDPAKVYDAKDIDAIRQQLNSQIARADAAAKSGSATGDVSRYLKQIKSAFDEDYYQQLGQVTNPESANALQQASTEYAQVAKAQTKGPAKNIFKAATPEQTIARLSNADATTINSFTKGMTEEELQPVRDGIFRRLLERSTENGEPNFTRALNRFDRDPAAAEALYGDSFNEYRDALKQAAKAQRTGQAVKSLLKKGALGAAAGVGGYGAYHVLQEFIH